MPKVRCRASQRQMLLHGYDEPVLNDLLLYDWLGVVPADIAMTTLPRACRSPR